VIVFLGGCVGGRFRGQWIDFKKKKKGSEGRESEEITGGEGELTRQEENLETSIHN